MSQEANKLQMPFFGQLQLRLFYKASIFLFDLKPYSKPHECQSATGVSGNSRSRPFPRMKASDSLSRIMGMDFFIPFPFPYFGNAFFSFPSRSRIVGMDFFHSPTVPDLWEWIFLIPFPFLNLLFHRRESKRELDYCKRYQASNFFQLPLYFSKQLY